MEQELKQIKICTKCNKEKRLTDFTNRKSSKDGKNYWCKECANTYKSSNNHRRKDKNLNAIEKQRLKEEKRARLEIIAKKEVEKNGKVCNKCKQRKSKDDFAKYNKPLDGLYATCKECKSKYLSDNYSKFFEKRQKTSKLIRARNRAIIIAANKERQVRKLQAMPKWADKQKITDIYKIRQKISDDTGVIHHVDHIVPLKSSIVCGLHCEDNLQVIPAIDNMRKCNKYWPDMPE